MTLEIKFSLDLMVAILFFLSGLSAIVFRTGLARFTDSIKGGGVDFWKAFAPVVGVIQILVSLLFFEKALF